MGYLPKHFEVSNFRNAKIYSLCPSCGKNTFRRYVYKATGVEVHPSVGYCENERKCGYWYSAFSYFNENNLIGSPLGLYSPPSYIPLPIVQKSWGQNTDNEYFNYLESVFGSEKSKLLFEKYCLGTAKTKWKGSPIFWQFDCSNRVRTGRIVKMIKGTGIIENIGVPMYEYVHQKMNDLTFNSIECLFGEHLLKSEPNKDVIVVKEESTAVIGAGFYSSVLWLSTAGHDNPTQEMCRALNGRNVNWFPKNGYDQAREILGNFF